MDGDHNPCLFERKMVLAPRQTLHEALVEGCKIVIGCSLYYIGLALIIWHDTIQRDLRPCPGNERYCIPRDGLFHYVSSAQYFAELVCWSGFCNHVVGTEQVVHIVCKPCEFDS